jgi:hypothetical protein
MHSENGCKPCLSHQKVDGALEDRFLRNGSRSKCDGVGHSIVPDSGRFGNSRGIVTPWIDGLREMTKGAMIRAIPGETPCRGSQSQNIVTVFPIAKDVVTPERRTARDDRAFTDPERRSVT